MSTVGLNIIVGPGEASILTRCLKSFVVPGRFDEVVIVNTSGDAAINKVAEEYKAKCLFYQWESERYPFGNFGGARDFARQNTTADKIMWLDSDDVCLQKDRESLDRTIDLVKDNKYNNVMIWTIPYAIVIDECGNPLTWFRRERIFDRKNICWERPVHELMVPGIDLVKNANINGMYITHLPSKPTYVSAVRNTKILEHEYNSNKDDTQTRYFFGRDLLFVGRQKEGLEILEDIVSEMSTSYEMLYAISIELAWFYTYGSSSPRPPIVALRRDNLLQAESWCRLAITFDNRYAEPYTLLGDVYLYKNDSDAAIRMYMTAMKKRIGEGKYQTMTMYHEIPSMRLSKIFETRRSYGLSLHYIQNAIQITPLPEYITQRSKIVEGINGFCKN